MQKRNQEIVSFILILAILFFAALNGNRFFRRVDMTENKIYSISDVSKNLFREIPDEVNITYYLSEKLTRVTPVPQQVKDILYEYATYSRGKISVEVVDPAETEEAREIENLGVVPQRIRVIEQNEESYAIVYTGVVIRYLDSYETLPLVFDISTLEYELTSNIRKLVSGKDKIAGLLIGEAGLTMNQNFRSLGTSLSQTFEFREIEKAKPIPPDVSVLFVVGGRDLNETDIYYIDQYIMKGGKVFFALDPVFIDLQRNLTAVPLENAPVFDLLEHYGIVIKPDLVLDSNSLQFPLRQQRGQVTIQTFEDYPHWISIQPENTAMDNPITARFTGLDLFWASPLELTDKDIEAEILANSSDDSWLMRKNLNTNPYEASVYARNREEAKGHYPVVSALSAEFESYFAKNEVPEGIEGQADFPESAETRMIVAGDSHFCRDLFQQFVNSRQSGGNYNMDFLANSAEWLSNDEDLLSIKTRASRNMRLDKIADPTSEKTAVFFIQFINVFLVPLLVVAYGIIRTIRRRKRTSAGEKVQVKE